MGEVCQAYHGEDGMIRVDVVVRAMSKCNPCMMQVGAHLSRYIQQAQSKL